MSMHEQYAEDLALYAMGSLIGDERAAIEKHLEECADCRRELELLRGDMALLAYSSAHSAPPRRSRQRLMDAVQREPRRKEVPARRSWWAAVPWLAAAAMTILAVLLMRQNTGLQDKLSNLRDRTARQDAQLERAREVVATLTATDALLVTLVASKTAPQPQGKAIYVRDRGSLIFIASNFAGVPSGRAYELWLIPTKGNPIPAGVFKPDAHGSAIVVNPPLPSGVEAKAFAITVEQEAGSPVPTSPVIMLGTGE
jgi:anti-sigma-K factor RskA